MNDIATQAPSTAPSTMRRSLAPTTYAEAFEFAQHLAKSSMVPTEYRGKPENILLAIQWGMEVGLAPLQAIQNIAVINGKPSVYGDALLAMVKGSPVCEDVIESFEGDGETLTAICEARRRGKAPGIVKFGVADAKKAGLWGKSGPWTQYPRRMLQMRARGFALRDAFPDVLRGVITAEEAADYPVDVSKAREPIDVTPKHDLDAFAKAGEVVDANTGEIRTAPPVEELAREAAAKGREEFRAFLKELSREEFDAIRPLVGTRDEPGELTLLATSVDEARERDPFGRPPLDRAHSGTSPEAGGGSDAQMAEAQASSPDGRGPTATTTASHSDFAQRFAALVPQRIDLTSDELDWRQYSAVAQEQVKMLKTASRDEAALPLMTTPALQRMQKDATAEFGLVRSALNQRIAELQDDARGGGPADG